MDSLFLFTEREKWHSYAMNLLSELGIDPSEHLNKRIRLEPEQFKSFIQGLANQAYTQNLSFQRYLTEENSIYSPYIGAIYFKENFTFKGFISFIEKTFDTYLRSLPSWKAYQYFFNFRQKYQIVLENGFPKMELKHNKIYIYAFWSKLLTSSVEKNLIRLRNQYRLLKSSDTTESLQHFLSINYGILNKSVRANSLAKEVA